MWKGHTHIRKLPLKSPAGPINLSFLINSSARLIDQHISIVIASILLVSLLFSPQDGKTPLYTASYIGRTDVVRILLVNKADPNISNNVSYSIIPFQH